MYEYSYTEKKGWKKKECSVQNAKKLSGTVDKCSYCGNELKHVEQSKGNSERK